MVHDFGNGQTAIGWWRVSCNEAVFWAPDQMNGRLMKQDAIEGLRLSDPQNEEKLHQTHG